MNAISIKQPFALLIAIGLKTIETRSWKTDYRGKLLICAAQDAHTGFYLSGDKKRPCEYFVSKIRKATNQHLAFGHAIAISNLVDVRPMKKEDERKALIPFFPDAYAWVLENTQIIKTPFPITGQMGIFNAEIPNNINLGCHQCGASELSFCHHQ